jgi:hypothetical protein
LIKTFGKKAKDPTDKLEFTDGLNQFVWDMNYPAGEKSEGMILWNGGVGTVKAAPGKYTATFKFEKDSATISFVIKANPNYAMTEADYDAQVAFLLDISNKFGDVQKGIKKIRSVKTQITDFIAKQDTAGIKDLKQLADSITKQLTTIEEALYQTKSKSFQDVLNFPIRLNDKLAGLYGVAASGQNPPSKQARETLADLGGQADVQLTKLKKIMDNEVVAFNQLINKKQLPIIGVKEKMNGNN